MLVNKMKKLIYILIVFFVFAQLQANTSILLKEARQLYYKSTQDEDAIEKAIEKFNQIKLKDNKLNGVATTYIGSLTAVKAKYATLPTTKYSLAMDGIEQMKNGLTQCPDNIEALFVYGSTCHHLPFFFGKAKEAEETLKKIITLSELNYKNYEKEVILNSLNFISVNIELSNTEKERIEVIRKKISKN